MGLASGALTPALFSPWPDGARHHVHRAAAARPHRAPRGRGGPLRRTPAMQPGDGGIDDLVFGEHEDAPGTRQSAASL
jgi:hypothetical protein